MNSRGASSANLGYVANASPRQVRSCDLNDDDVVGALEEDRLGSEARGGNDL